jgi:RHS repeat-associated protein
MAYPTSPDQRARSAAYNAPTSTETFYSIGNNAVAPLRRTTSEYNDFCLPLSTTDELHSGAAGGYVKQATVLNVYKLTRLGTMQATKTSQKDEVSQFEQISENILTSDEKNIASTSITFKEGNAPSRSWTRKAFEYDAEGRITSETLSWLPDASVPGDSVASTTTKTRYTYGSGKLTVAKLDAFGNTTTSQHDLRKPGGPVTLTRLPLGETETVEFDRIGREISRTDALGNKTATKHVVGPRGSSVTTTSPMGYVQTTTLDVLDREVETSDNGDETSGHPRTRVLSKKVYDIQSRVVEEVDGLGLRTAYKYDDLDRPTEITDPKGNAVTYTYLSGGLEIRQALNGSPRSIIYMNARSEPISIVHHPDSDVGSNERSLQEEHAYDGRGNIIAKTWSDIDTSGKSHVREAELTVFGVNGTITTQTTIGHTAAGADKVQRSFTYDIFGNVYTYLKETSYSDGRHFSHPGPIDIFDKANKLVTSRNQLGQEEHRAYDADARLSQLTRLDGSKVQYAYDGAGRLNQTTYPSSGRSLRTYDADGRLVKVSQAGEDVAYTYSLDGTEVGVRNSDGKVQTRLLDAFGRVVEETDAVGNTTKTAFDSYGNVSSRSKGGEEIKYRYGPSKHTKMQLLSTQQSGQASATTSYAYDGFGRVRKTTVEYGKSGKLLMDTTQTHDYKGRVTAMTTVSELVKELESKRVLEYDGLGQLIRDTRSGESGRGEEATTYEYDGNSNVVVADINGTRSTSSFNAIDQRTDAGFGYDANGRLIRDPKGNEYKFDDRDRLTSVSSSGQSSTYGYAPNDYLSGYKDDTQSANLYFDGGVANAISFSSDGTREETSILSDAISDRPLSTIGKKSTTSQAKTRHLVNQLGSTVAVVSNPDHSSADQESHYISKSYDAYGAPRHSSASASSSAVDASSLLGFASEFTSPVGDIVYLRARHYNPHLKTFLSMDPRIPGSDRVTENRYAYCGGDPVNRIDPTGRSWSWLEDHPVLTTIIGLAVGLLVGVGTGLAVEAAIGWGIAALSSSFGIEIAAAVPAWAIAVGTQFIAGAAGGLVGGMAAAGATGDFGSYTWATAGLDFVGGGLGAVAALGVRPFIRKAFNSPRMAWTNRVGTRMRNFSKWAGRKGAGKVVTLSITKGIPALEKAFASVGMGVAVSIEEAKDWAHPVLKLQSEGLILHRVKRINFEKCGLGYGG